MWKAKGRLCRILFAGFVGTFIAVSSWSALAAEAWKLPDSGIIMADKEKQAYVAEKMGKIFQPATNTPKATNGQVPKSNFAAPDGWEYTVFSLGDLSVEQLNNPFATSKRTVLQFHGGGYINSLGDGHRLFCVKQMVLTDAKAGYIVDYRTAPQNTYPAALEDAVRAYEDILAKGTAPQDIVVFGDSAGGNLALELSLYLREHNMPQPGAMVLASPWATFETDLPSRKQNADRDLILGKINPRMYNEILNPSYGKGLSAKDVHLSPMYADLAGLPPMLIQAGGYELFLDESIALAQKAAGDGTDVTLTVYPGMSHDFALLLPELDDSVKSFKEIRDFVDRYMEK
ncbi:MAG: alpha/beta hydrolase [Anaerovibrio sp.]|uniref:alpha/beta hydrolase n=1 Tax=Anaerovibrio sp. TaxID=1872532 RepID=UPI001B245665|nr:alpha/beta hydrolase [Anaerovibrio sp.]MBO6246611.1 alpha/beta hydrolase [Anaerovibrio sp.]